MATQVTTGRWHILLDVDGTLFDTEFDVSRLSADLAVEKGCRITAEEVHQRFSGLGSRAKFEAIAQHAGGHFSHDDLTYLSQEHERRKQALYDRDTIPVVAGVPQVLAVLRDAGHLLSVGSTNKTARSQLGLTKTGLLHFVTESQPQGDDRPYRIYGPDLVEGRKKPDPAIFQKAMAVHGSVPSDTIVIEDSAPGVVAGQRAGARVIAYLDQHFGQGPAAAAREKDLREAGAFAVVRHFQEISGIVGDLPLPQRAPRGLIMT